MRLLLVSLIMFNLFVVVDVYSRLLIHWKQRILITAKESQASAAAFSAHRHPLVTTPPAVLHRPANRVSSSHGSVISDKASSKHREKRASGFAAEGMQISPVLALKVTDVFNRPLTDGQGPTQLRVGDSVRFIINLTRDATYNSLEVTSCTVSTSPTMPDPNAETRVLLIKGCPLPDEATAASWYWTSEMSTNTTFVSSTQPVPIFRLSSSEFIYLHVSMKMCFTGYAPCQQPTSDDCLVAGSKRKKRDNFLPMKRRRRQSQEGVADVNQTLALRVIDPTTSPTQTNPLQVGAWGFIALIVLVSLIGFLVIVLLIILVIVIVDRRPKRRRISQPQQFAQQRVTPTNRRCPCCC